MEYLKDQNGAQAAIRAGYSKRSAKEIAARMLTNDNVRQAVDDGLRKIEDKAMITGEKVLKELWNLGNVDHSQAYNPDGSIKAIGDMPEDLRRAICSVETETIIEGKGKNRTTRVIIKRIKFWDKVRPLELIGKNQKLFLEEGTFKHLHAGVVGNPPKVSPKVQQAADALSVEQLKKMAEKL